MIILSGASLIAVSIIMLPNKTVIILNKDCQTVCSGKIATVVEIGEKTAIKPMHSH